MIREGVMPLIVLVSLSIRSCIVRTKLPTLLWYITSFEIEKL